MRTIKNFINLFTGKEFKHIENDVNQWRKDISNAVFTYFSVFAFFSYVPSLYLSIKEEEYSIAIISTLAYIFCITITLLRKIDHTLRSFLGIVLFYSVGLIILIALGPVGAGEIWLFATTILAAYLLGNRGALLAFAFHSVTLIGIWILLKTEVLAWEAEHNIFPAAWLIKSVNYIMLNFIFVIANALFIRRYKQRVSRSVETRNATIIGLAKLAEYRDRNTGEHLYRIQEYITILSKELQKSPKYRNYITEEYLRDLRISAILHDIGKVGIQDSILLKQGKLTSQEFDTIKQHPQIGANVIAEIEKNISGQSLFSLGKEIAFYHHERWDGTGYPKGLKGDSIPLSARITSLVDVYDALASERPYKDPMPHNEIVKAIQEQRGAHFDPDIVDAFMKTADLFRDVQIPPY